MALLPVADVPSGEEWLYELKWDGFRCQALKHGNNVRLFSKNGNDFSDKFPEVTDAVARLRCHSALIDGEIVALQADGRPCFQRLQNGDRSDCVITFYGFDLLHLNGSDLCRRPLEERKGELEGLLRGSGVRFSASLTASPAVLLREIEGRQLEGLVAKRRSSRYEAGKRSGAWVKYKVLRQDDFVIGAYRPVDGSFDCVLVGHEVEGELRYVGKVLAGFTPRMRRNLLGEMKQFQVPQCPFGNLPQRSRGRWRDGITAEDMPLYRWVKPTFRVRLGYTEWTDVGFLRHPKVLALTGWE